MASERYQKISSRITLRFVIISFIVGALSGTIGDFCHVITNTDGYPKDGRFPFLPWLPVNMPVWVPVLFGSAVTLMACIHKSMVNQLRPRMRDSRDVAFAAPILFVILYALTGFIGLGTGGLQDVWIATAAFLFWFLLDRSFYGAMMAFVIAVSGTGFEMMLVHNKAFFYYPEHANFLGVPSWLPWLYVAASVSISVFVRWVK